MLSYTYMRIHVYVYTQISGRVAGGGPGAAAQLMGLSQLPSMGADEAAGGTGTSPAPACGRAHFAGAFPQCRTQWSRVPLADPPINPVAPWMLVSAPARASPRAAPGCGCLGQKEVIQRLSWAACWLVLGL